MALVRLSMLFHHVSSTTSISDGAPVRVGGWSENLYFDDAAKMPASITAMQVRRAALLPANCAIIGQRYRFADGSSQTFTERFASPGDFSVDIPQMALQCTAKNLGMASIRKFNIRGLPDSWVVNGEWIGSGPAQSRLIAYFNTLVGFQWKGRLRSAAAVDVVSIDGNGVFVLADDLAFTLGGQIRLVRVTNDVGQNVTGIYRVLLRTDARNGKLANWKSSTVDSVGKFQLVSFQYPTFLAGQITYSRVAPRKVGRSFFQYRGRASKRRR